MKKYLLLALFFYLFCSVLVTYPLVFKINHATIDGSADTYLMLWTLSWDVHQLSANPFNLFNANYFYPHENTLALSEHHIGSALVAWPVMQISHNSVLAFNILILLYLVLGAIGAFALAYDLTRNFFTSLLAGILFGFAPYRLGHLSQLHVAVTIFPLAIFFLHRYLKNKKTKHLVLLGLFVLWQCLGSWHLGLFTYALIGLLLLLFKLAKLFQIGFKTIFRVVLVLFIVGLLLIPLYLPYLNTPTKLPKVSLERLLHYSPRLLDYLVVSPIFSNAFERPVSEERITYLGITTMILLIFLIIVFVKKTKLYYPQTKMLAVLVVSTIIFGLFSLGPLIRFAENSDGLVGPQYLVFKTLPFIRDFRVPTRFYLVALFCLVIIIAILINPWFKRMNKKKLFLFAGLCSAILIEYSFMHPFTPKRIVDIPQRDDLPQVYQWLAEQKGEFAIVELPIVGYVTFEAKKMYYSTFYWQRLVNGYNGYYPADYLPLEEKLTQFPSQESIAELRRLKVKYILYHHGEYHQKISYVSPEGIMAYPGVKEVVHFGLDYVYAISP